jgi:hypothetical protein
MLKCNNPESIYSANLGVINAEKVCDWVCSIEESSESAALGVSHYLPYLMNVIFPLHLGVALFFIFESFNYFFFSLGQFHLLYRKSVSSI